MKLSIKVEGIPALRAKLKEIESETERKKDLFLSRLADVGLGTAKVYFNVLLDEWTEGRAVTHDPDIQVRVEQDRNGYAVVAEGREVAFVEFGAGVFYNGAGAYLGDRPEGIVGIGQYGNGQGNRKAWGFYRDGEKFVTRGNPPANAMYFAEIDIKRQLEQIAKEVFK